ncbi:hypothetical protein BOO92_03125 [Vibrio navarrensis]|nr:hypothetical protein [Vibrio navarrensis]
MSRKIHGKGEERLRAVLRPYGPEKAVLGRARAALVPGRKAGKRRLLGTRKSREEQGRAGKSREEQGRAGRAVLLFRFCLPS